MERGERFMKIDRLIQSERSVSMARLLEHLEVSKSTIKRDLEYMRDRMHMPIIWDKVLQGYRYDVPDGEAANYALPGLWFNASEIYALLTMDHLLSTLQPGLLGPHIEPLRKRIQTLLEHGDHSAAEIANRIHISPLADRPVDPDIFATISNAVLSRKRIILHHYNRAKDTTTIREVSPQHLLYYRDNWYLDAWCHLRNGLRSFGIDVISKTKASEKKAKHVTKKAMNEVYRAGYGIFSGKKTHKAILKFTPERARWIADESWHSEQKGQFDKDGNYILTIPYSDDTELVLDILRYGPDVEVIAPESLRNAVKALLRRAVEQYEK